MFTSHHHRRSSLFISVAALAIGGAVVLGAPGVAAAAPGGNITGATTHESAGLFSVVRQMKPAIAAAPVPDATIEVPYSTALYAVGTIPLRYSASNLPPGLTMGSDGRITGTPTQTDSGFFTFIVTVENTEGSASARFVIAITNPSTAPKITTKGPLPLATVGKPFSFQFTASGDPKPTFTLAPDAVLGGLTLDPVSGVLSGTPTSSGTATIALTATNAIGATSDGGLFDFTVNPAAVVTPTPTPSPTVPGATVGHTAGPGDSSAASRGGAGGSESGHLASTGVDPTGLVAGGALALLLAGAGIGTVTYRRRRA